MKTLILGGKYLLLSLILFLNNVHANEDNFPQPVDLAVTAEQAESKNIPILVLFSSVYCDYCKFIKNEFLNPMIRSGDYESKVIIRVIEDDEGDEVIDFNRKLTDTGDFSERYNIDFTPTMIFIDAKGKELAERIVGLGNVEYYGGFIDDAIMNSQAKINLTVVGHK